MPRIEAVQTRVSDILDLEPTPIQGFPAFVEELVAKGVGFPIYQRKPIDPEKDEFTIRRKPIIAYCGKGTLVRIADPSDRVKGAFAIVNEILVYDPSGTQPHQYRDSYRWRYPPYHYYIDQGFEDVVRSYEEAGYPIFLCLDGWKFNKDKPVLEEQTTLEKIFALNNF